MSRPTGLLQSVGSGLGDGHPEVVERDAVGLGATAHAGVERVDRGELVADLDRRDVGHGDVGDAGLRKRGGDGCRHEADRPAGRDVLELLLEVVDRRSGPRLPAVRPWATLWKACQTGVAPRWMITGSSASSAMEISGSPAAGWPTGRTATRGSERTDTSSRPWSSIEPPPACSKPSPVPQDHRLQRPPKLAVAAERDVAAKRASRAPNPNVHTPTEPERSHPNRDRGAAGRRHARRTTFTHTIAVANFHRERASSSDLRLRSTRPPAKRPSGRRG